MKWRPVLTRRRARWALLALVVVLVMDVTGRSFLSWREVAEQAPGLIPPEHRRRYKWGTAWYEVWGIGIRNSIQRLCLRETLPFPYRMK